MPLRLVSLQTEPLMLPAASLVLIPVSISAAKTATLVVAAIMIGTTRNVTKKATNVWIVLRAL